MPSGGGHIIDAMATDRMRTELDAAPAMLCKSRGISLIGCAGWAADMSKPVPPSYRTTNWPADNQALCQRGSLLMWFNPEMESAAALNGGRGHSGLSRPYDPSARQNGPFLGWPS